MAADYLNSLGINRAGSKTAHDEAGVNGVTEKIIGCAIEVHRQLGPGLLEGTYEAAMSIELTAVRLEPRQTADFPGIVQRSGYW